MSRPSLPNSLDYIYRRSGERREWEGGVRRSAFGERALPFHRQVRHWHAPDRCTHGRFASVRLWSRRLDGSSWSPGASSQHPDGIWSRCDKRGTLPSSRYQIPSARPVSLEPLPLSCSLFATSYGALLSSFHMALFRQDELFRIPSNRLTEPSYRYVLSLSSVFFWMKKARARQAFDHPLIPPFTTFTGMTGDGGEVN